MLRSLPSRRHRRPPSALAPLAVAAALCAFAAGAHGPTLPRVRATPPPEPPKEAPGADVAPPVVTLSADDVVSHIGGVTQASGKVEVKRLDTDLFADRLTYDRLSDTAHAQGNVRIARGLDWFSADRVDLELTRNAGTLIGTEYELGARKAGGHAERIELHDRDHSTAYNANYTSCTRDGPDEPDWIISGSQIDIDTTANEGRATHAVLHFLGVPILAAPSLTFPVTAERKSGWLPPTGDLSNRSGLTLSVPYYWNIAPNIDATLSPGISTRRGAELAGELRYLQPNDLGQATVYALPDDKAQKDKSRGAFEWAHEGTRGDWLSYSARVQRVSDSAYWIDFPNQMPALTQRLLPTDLSGTRRFLPFGDAGEIDAYARVQRFQTLQDPDEDETAAIIKVPYQRSPQIGVRGNLTLRDQLRLDFEAEGDRFDLSDKTQENDYLAKAGSAQDTRVGGSRAHVLASVSREFSSDWGRFEPRLSMHGVSYQTDTQSDGSRIDRTIWVPTFSLDSSFSFERQARLFDRDLVQTLEPRLLYVLTPRRNQFDLPVYDTAPKDFNEVSIYSANDFTGNDRVSDNNELTAGVTTRYNDAGNGRELLRLGIAQKLLFAHQQLTKSNFDDTSGNPPPYLRRLSNLLLYGSSSAMEHWSFDGSIEIDPFHTTSTSTATSQGGTTIAPGGTVSTADQCDSSASNPVGGSTGSAAAASSSCSSGSWQTQRAIVSARYHPGPFRSFSLSYRYARDTNSRQYEVGGQWPVYHAEPRANGCNGTLYAVGRADYSAVDHRATYAIGGFEYDAGCWIGRLLVERTSTGSNQSTTHLVLQLELNGLSTLGTGSLKVLKDNVPGYQPLRNDPGAPAEATNSP